MGFKSSHTIDKIAELMMKTLDKLPPISRLVSRVEDDIDPYRMAFLTQSELDRQTPCATLEMDNAVQLRDNKRSYFWEKCNWWTQDRNAVSDACGES